MKLLLIISLLTAFGFAKTETKIKAKSKPIKVEVKVPSKRVRAVSPPPHFKVEAETAGHNASCTCQVKTDLSASGKKYIDINDGNFMFVKFNANVAGTHNYEIRIKSPDGSERSMSAWLNGEKVKVHTTKSKNWIIKSKEGVVLKAKDNIFELRDTECSKEFDVDYIYFIKQ